MSFFTETMLDLNTKRSVAFYALLAVAIYDVIRHSLNLYNGGALLALAGIATADAFMSKKADQ